MAAFAAFISPADFGGWQRRIAFGDALPSERCSGLVHLEVDSSADPTLLAAFAGKLSTRQPTGFLQPAADAAADEAQNPSTITLYIEPTAAKLVPEWALVSRAITSRYEASASNALTVNVIGYFIYRNVDASSAKDLLCPRLRSTKKVDPPAACDEAAWQQFLAGKPVPVSAGDPIGKAGTLGQSRQVAIGLRTRYGMYDPGQFYQDLSTALGPAAPPGTDALVQGLLQSQRPLIDPTRDIGDVGVDRLWPWSELLQYQQGRTSGPLKYSEWRALGDLQKSIYLAQLRARARPGSASAITRFVYDVDDMSNLFQLEAVVEFYANFREPWNRAAQPLVAGGQNYRLINFLSLYGSDARISGTQVTLDDRLDMSRIMPGRDTIFLEAATGREGKQFRIMAVDRNQQVVTVDIAPQVTGSSAWRIFHNPTLVQIDAFGSRVRGALAVNTASDTLELQQLSKAQLDALEQVNRFETIELFDVAQGQERNARLVERPALDQTSRSAIVKLDRSLTAPAAGSAWAIPSGVGGVQERDTAVTVRDKAGELSTGVFGLRPTGSASGIGPYKEYDQYDGMMFLVTGGAIRAFFPWTSFTSRALPTDSHSSIKGNAVYRYGSACSSNPYINLGFRVVDTDGLLWGDDAASTVGQVNVTLGPDANPAFVKGQKLFFLWPAQPRFRLAYITKDSAGRVRQADAANVPASPSPYWIFAHAGVRDARYYFTEGLDPDVCPPDKVPGLEKYEPPLATGDDLKGKAGIFIHKGEGGYWTSSGSAGCQVSPSFMSLRAAMVTYDGEANATFYQECIDPPKFRSEHHWEEHKPALLSRFLNLHDQQKSLVSEIQVFKKTLAPLVKAIATKGATDVGVKKLADAIKKAESFPKGEPDASGEGPPKETVLDALQDILDGASNDAVTARMQAEQAQLAQELQEHAARLTQKTKELDQQIKEEIAAYGWDDAIHGEYWLIRPDERFAP